MEQKSEQINLEYKVEFEDGLKPMIRVYGINSENKEVYGAEVMIGALVGAGYNVTGASDEDLKNKGLIANVTIGTGLNLSLAVSRLTGNLPEDEDWEQKMYEVARKNRSNVIKVQNPDHVNPAIDRHVELYRKQFHELGNAFLVMFQGFIRKYPGYGFH